MQLPVDEKDDEQVVGVPEPFEVCTTLLLHRIPHDYEKTGGHDPTSDTRTCCKVDGKECENALARGLYIWIRDCESIEIHHVRSDMDDGPGNNGPCRGFVEGDVLVERYDTVQRGPSEERDEISANRQQDEDDIDMEDKSSCACDR
jgi:hypothetical protein